MQSELETEPIGDFLRRHPDLLGAGDDVTILDGVQQLLALLLQALQLSLPLPRSSDQSA